MSPLLLAKLTYLLGATNIIGLILVFFSCRCLMGQRISTFLFQYSWYKRFYAKHCYFWWFFFLSVALHSLLALFAFGNPFLGS